PCLFAEDTIDAKGKVKKSYPQRLVMTPLEKLASLPDAETFLKPGITLAQLQAEATRLTDKPGRPAAQRSPGAPVSIH
ncbi:MAG: hypothetical protein ACREXV_15720, partial [Polaromonas sp.]